MTAQLARECALIDMARAIRGFARPEDVPAMLARAGYSAAQIAENAVEAARRELMRRKIMGTGDV